MLFYTGKKRGKKIFDQVIREESVKLSRILETTGSKTQPATTLYPSIFPLFFSEKIRDLFH